MTIMIAISDWKDNETVLFISGNIKNQIKVCYKRYRGQWGKKKNDLKLNGDIKKRL